MFTVLVFVLGGVLGAAGGAGAMLVAYPFLFPPPVSADAAPAALPDAAPAIAFRFDESAPGRDAVHWANGSGRVVKTAQGWVLRLDADFKAGPGPNFWIYLNTRAVGDERDFKGDARRVKLAPLKSFEGAQNFVLPPSIDPAEFHSVTIWCESFSQYIASGSLQRLAG
jgi:hypothetical protein